MKTKAVRLHGEKDLRLEEFDLPEISDGEILIRVICDSICMSTYKTAMQGAKHLRVPDNVSSSPVIIGHEAVFSARRLVKSRANLQRGRISLLKLLHEECERSARIDDVFNDQDILAFYIVAQIFLDLEDTR